MKIVLKVVAGLLLLLVVALGALLLFFDPNAHKAELIALARDKGSVALTIDGELGWSLFPRIALALPALRVDDLDGQPLAAVDGAEVSVAVLPLLRGKVEMSGVTLQGLRLDLVAPEPAPAAETESVPSDAAAAPPGAAPQLDIGFIDIRDAEISYRMPQSGQVARLSGFNFHAERVVSGRPFPVSSRFNLALGPDGKPAQLTLQAELAAQLLLDLANQHFGADALRLRLGVGGTAFQGRTVPVELQADLQAQLAAERVSIDQLLVKVADMALQGQLQVAQLSTAPLISGKLAAAPFDLNQLLQALGQPALVTRDSDALSQVGFSAEFSGPANTLLMKPLQLRLDDSRFDGELGLDLASGRQRVVLSGDRLDLDRYLPPAPAEAEAAAAPAAPAQADGERYSKDPLLPVALLQGLNFELRLGLAELVASGLQVNDLQLAAEAAGGLIEAKTLSGRLYQGGFANSATLDARQTPLQIALNKKLSGVQLGPLLQDLAQIDRVSGTLALEGRYRTRGNSVYAWVNGLNGNSVIGLTDGRVKGINLVDSLCQGIRQVKGLPASDGTAPDYTHFSNLSATLKITDGVVDNRDLAASLVAVGLAGAGQVSLPAATLDYGLDLTVLQQLQGERCQIEEKLHNLAFPVRCKGGFDDDPAKLCKPDTARMKQVIGELLKRDSVTKLKQKVEDKMQDKVPDKLKDNEQLKDALKGLFK